MSTTTYLITGSSRGIGLEFARQILGGDEGARVIAAVRSPATADRLHALEKEYPGRIEYLELDVSSLESISAAAEAVKSLSFAQDGIDILLNNAGSWAGKMSNALAPDVLATLDINLRTNLIGPVAVTTAFLPLLRLGREKTIWTTSTNAGSFTNAAPYGDKMATYATSKAGLNMFHLKLAEALRPERFKVLAFHPGFVKTEAVEGFGAVVEPADSVRGALATLRSKSVEHSGAFLTWEGEVQPW